MSIGLMLEYVVPTKKMEISVPQAVIGRLDQLLQALQKVQGDTQVAVYIG